MFDPRIKIIQGLQLKTLVYMGLWCFSRLFALDSRLAGAPRTASPILFLPLLPTPIHRSSRSLLIQNGGCNISWQSLLLLPCF